MSVLACLCGAAIRNNTYPCGTEGSLIRQSDEIPTSELCATTIAKYVEAHARGEGQQWCVSFFSSDYPADCSLSEVIDDIISETYFTKHLSVAECESCGRLWIQTRHGENVYASFSPDESGYHAILSGTKKDDCA